MLKLNKTEIAKIGTIFPNLNTSYVEVKLFLLIAVFFSRIDLNTSYVEVKPKEIKELIKDTNVFKYILCWS